MYWTETGCIGENISRLWNYWKYFCCWKKNANEKNIDEENVRKNANEKIIDEENVRAEQKRTWKKRVKGWTYFIIVYDRM